jgi:hypothetical protein
MPGLLDEANPHSTPGDDKATAAAARSSASCLLRYRAMIHGVSAQGISLRPYFNRYTEDAIDLCDALSSFSPQGKVTLHEISMVRACREAEGD